MNNRQNRRIYRCWAPLYDAWIPLLYGQSRKRALALLNLQPGERLLIPGVGTGLDLPQLPAGAVIIGADYSPEMLCRAKAKESDAALVQMDAQALGIEDESFDAVLFNLILTVVPDGVAAFQQAWRTLRPGGRAVIFDKFMPENATLTHFRRLIGWLVRMVGTDPNRRLQEIIQGTPDLIVERDEPSLLRGQYRVLLLRKKNANSGHGQNP